MPLIPRQIMMNIVVFLLLRGFVAFVTRFEFEVLTSLQYHCHKSPSPGRKAAKESTKNHRYHQSSAPSL